MILTRFHNLICLIVICTLVCGSLYECKGDDSQAEYKIKAAFIYNFAKFVEWPQQAFVNNNSPVIIGVLGRDPFGDILDDTVKNKTIGKRKIVVTRYKDVSNIGVCHILFISSSEKKRLLKIADKLKGTSILTVGEVKNFARKGGIIGFVRKEDTIGLEINLTNARQAKLKISSKLLKISKVIVDK